MHKIDKITVTNPGSGYQATPEKQEFIYALIALYGGGDYRKDKNVSPIEHVDKYVEENSDESIDTD